MNPQNNIGKVVSWSIELETSNLARDVVNYYQINDYVMVEGYLSIQDNKNSKVLTPKLKKAQISVIKIYPIKN